MMTKFIGGVFIVGGLLWGCFNPFAPELADDDIDGQFITQQGTPEDVLQNFRYAYTFRDSLLYADVLDSAFTFEFFNPDAGESGAFESWTRDTELKTTGRLLRSFEAIELLWLNTIYQSATNDSEQILYKSFRLTLVGNAINATLGGYAIFTFRKSADGKWRIKRWVDESSL